MKPINWLTFVLLLLCGWILWEWPTKYPVMVMCDVGQGDAMVITQGFSQMLVDTGNEPEKIMRCLGRHVPFWDRQLELVVLTHPEVDHMGSFAEIMQAYAVKILLASPIGNDTKEFKSIYHTISKSSIEVITAQQGLKLHLGDAKITTLWPLPQEDSIWQRNYLNRYQNISSLTMEEKALIDAENPNESSIVLAIHLEDIKMLLTGDISSEVELALVGRGLIEVMDILKIAHHGSKTSSEDLFFDKVKPDLALISVGGENRYGHPHPLVISRLTNRKIPIKRTDVDGEIQTMLLGGSILAEKYPSLPDWISLFLGQVIVQ
jgi:competence protein ComEC